MTRAPTHTVIVLVEDWMDPPSLVRDNRRMMPPRSALTVVRLLSPLVTSRRRPGQRRVKGVTPYTFMCLEHFGKWLSLRLTFGIKGV